MKKIFIIILLLFNVISAYSQNNKFIKWQDPSYFRGYNVLYETPKRLQDFIDFRNYGGNLFQIGTDGFMDEDPPYDIIQANIDGTDLLVNFCMRSGIYYTIAVRSGPGAYDTYDESQGWTPESRIWNTGNFAEQRLYALMLRMIIERYSQDTLFVGLNLVVEPRPKFRFIPANNSSLYKWFLENVFNIHMDQVYQFFINEIRAVYPEIPIILENFAFSTPELFPAYVLNDPYIIYSSHNYQPKEYTNASLPYSRTYPGIYWNITFLSQQYYDANFMRQTVFSRLRSFEITTRAPIFLGEFGMLYPQNGGPDYLRDVLDICLDYGWHFALWDWRRSQGQQWNIENFQGDQNLHWKTVLSKLHAPPVPTLVFPENGAINVSLTPTFIWDSLTAFTTYDIQVYEGANLIGGAKNINRARWTYSGNPLQEGITYTWRVRSKNPGGMPVNWSNWSDRWTFTTSLFTGIAGNNSNIPKEFKLYANYPNPFNAATIIKFQISKLSYVSLKVFDIKGSEILTLVNEKLSPGEHKIDFNGNNLSSGIYFYKLEAKGLTNELSEKSDKLFADTKKMIIIK